MTWSYYKENNYRFLDQKYDLGVKGFHWPTWRYYKTGVCISNEVGLKHVYKWNKRWLPVYCI